MEFNFFACHCREKKKKEKQICKPTYVYLPCICTLFFDKENAEEEKNNCLLFIITLQAKLFLFTYLISFALLRDFFK